MSEHYVSIANDLSGEHIGKKCYVNTPKGGFIEGTLKYITKYSYSNILEETHIVLGFIEFENAAFTVNGNSEAGVRNERT